MPRYIDANELKSRIDLNEHNTGIIEKWIDMCPTADVTPVIHAHWVVYRYCSHCDCDIHDYGIGAKLPKYCPDCGARMDEKEQDSTCISKQ